MPTALSHFAAPRFGTQDHVLRAGPDTTFVITDGLGRDAIRVDAGKNGGIDVSAAGDPYRHYVLDLIA